MKHWDHSQSELTLCYVDDAAGMSKISPFRSPAQPWWAEWTPTTPYDYLPNDATIASDKRCPAFICREQFSN